MSILLVLIVVICLLVVLIMRISELSTKYSAIEHELSKCLCREDLDTWYLSMTSGSYQ